MQSLNLEPIEAKYADIKQLAEMDVPLHMYAYGRLYIQPDITLIKEVGYLKKFFNKEEQYHAQTGSPLLEFLASLLRGNQPVIFNECQYRGEEFKLIYGLLHMNINWQLYSNQLQIL